MTWSNFMLDDVISQQDLKRLQNTILQLLAFTKICYRRAATMGGRGGKEDYPALFENQRKKEREEKITNQ